MSEAGQNIKLVMEYNGAGFYGWQKQSGTGLRTVQGVLETALKQLTGEERASVGAGRTDAGVHALGQVANFAAGSGIPVERWSQALNAVLPKDVSVVSAEAADPSFHARYSAIAKEYCYLIWNRPQRSAIWDCCSGHVGRPLDVGRMTEGAACYAGNHDFRAFSANGGNDISTVRQVFASSIFAHDEWIGFRVAANGFLYRMVRMMAGMLVEIGLGKSDPSRIRELLATGEHGQAGQVLPPQGLFLVRVAYGGEPAVGTGPELQLFGHPLIGVT